MKVAFDAHMIGQHETGNESYAANLLTALAAGWPEDVYQVMTTDRAQLTSTMVLPANAPPVRVWPSWSPARITLAVPAIARWNRADVVHMTTYVVPPVSMTRTVVTVHDLSYLVYPEAFSRRVRTMLTALVPRSVRRADRVIAVSEHTKRDLVRFYRLDPDKIAVTPLAPGPEFVVMREAAATPLPPGVKEPFVLAVGNLEPRKNLGRLLEAFFALVRERGFEGQLVLVGKGSGGGEILSRARDQGLESRVVLTGFVSQPELVLLYNRAKLFVYPSLYEGFGLPPIEAMACGCPVVASNTSVLPETLGDAALLVDPLSVSRLVEAIAAVLDREALAAQLVEKGIQRSHSLSWHDTARRTHAAYEVAITAGRKRR